MVPFKHQIETSSKDLAYRTKDTDPDSFRKAKADWRRAVKSAKQDYKDKLESNFDTRDSRKLWANINLITQYKGPIKNIDSADSTLPNQLNDFYARFDRDNTSVPEFAMEGAADPAFLVREEDVRRNFRKLEERKAAGPDGLSPRILETCADQLPLVVATIYNWSLSSRKVPTLFKRATVIPVPKKSAISSLNDYRPVAITSVAMKAFEKIILNFIKTLLPRGFDQYQFAYRGNRCVEDAITIVLHKILQHLMRTSTYARILFIDYSSAFNTIISFKLHFTYK